MAKQKINKFAKQINSSKPEVGLRRQEINDAWYIGTEKSLVGDNPMMQETKKKESEANEEFQKKLGVYSKKNMESMKKNPSKQPMENIPPTETMCEKFPHLSFCKNMKKVKSNINSSYKK
jgi:cyanate lyase